MLRTIIVACLFLILTLPIYSAELVSENFETNLSPWTIISENNNKAQLSSTQKYTGDKSLHLSYTTANSPNYIYRTFPTPYSNVVMRVYFFDTMDSSLGSMVEAKGSSDTIGTGIGVNTNVNANNYVYRFNSLSNTFDSGIKRTPGWHMFEVIVTDDGYARVKIDNILIRNNNDRNTSQNTINSIYFVSSWGLTGESYYDNLNIYSPTNTANKDDKDLYLEIIKDYYDIYKNVDFSQLANNPNRTVNDTRSMFDTATTFYIYAINFGDQNAVNKAKSVYMDGMKMQETKTLENWVRGIEMIPLVYSTYIMWDDLDIATQKKALTIIERELQNPLTGQGNRVPQSDFEGNSSAEENAWTAAFLASSTNFFPKIDRKEELQNLAKCFAYHSITTSQSFANSRGDSSTYCNVTTQTVYDNNGKFQISNRRDNSGKGIITPLYAFSALHMLSQGALSYIHVGEPIPTEFKHNYEALFNETMASADLNSYHFLNEYPRLWDGATDSVYYGLGSIQFMKYINRNNSYYQNNTIMTDMFQKRSIYYKGIGSDWIKEPKFTKITSFDQNSATNPARNWFLDTNIVGNVYAYATMELEHVGRPQRIIGDLDDDEDVDENDKKILRDSIFNSPTKKTDVNKDAKVDVKDLVQYLTHVN